MTLPEEPTPLPEEQPAPEERPASPPTAKPPLARRRRQARRLIPNTPDERAAALERLAHRTFPTLEFFIFTTLAGALLGAGFLIDSPSILFLGILLIPIMSPWVGTILAAVTGSWRFFFQTFAGLLIGAFLVFLTGLLAGFAAQVFMPLTFNQAFIHTRLWWPDIFVLLLGAVLLPISFARSEGRPLLPSLMLSYELFLPLSAAAVGLGSGVSGLWPDGLMVFATYLALATLAGIITMLIMGFRPYTLGGYTLGTTVTLIVILVVISLSGLGTYITSQLGQSPTATPTTSGVVPAQSSPTLSLPTPTPAASTPVAPTATPSVTPTLFFPTPPTATTTPPPQPTPVFARVYSREGNGIIVRDAPDGNLVMTLVNGYLVEVLPELQEYDRAVWVKIRFILPEGTKEGWVIQSLLQTATPLVDWQPTNTP